MKTALALLCLASCSAPGMLPAPCPTDAGSPVSLDPIVEVRVGEVGYCTRTAAGRVRCHSQNEDFTVVEANARALAVSGTFVWHIELLACALLDEGRIECKSELRRYGLTVEGAVGLTVGDNLACAWTGAGAVSCWSPLDGATPPVPEEGLPPVASVAAGSSFACALTTAGAVRCFGGDNGNGELDVPPGVRAVQISAGAYHACALSPEGELFCWGRDPERKLPGTRATAIGCGFFDTCWLDSESRASCWSNGALVIPPLPPLHGLSVGGWGVCGLDASGAVACAGGS